MEKGCIELIMGPMFSGKSTELLRRIKRNTIAKKSCVLVKYKFDTRYSIEGVATHDHQSVKGISCSTLEEIYSELSKYQVIGIDEGQFFKDIVEYAEKLADAGKTVIVAALDGTFQRKPFGRILELVPVSEKVCKLTAICVLCGDEASFTQRIGKEVSVEVIGGEEMYRPLCRSCFKKPTEETDLELKKVKTATSEESEVVEDYTEVTEEK